MIFYSTILSNIPQNSYVSMEIIGLILVFAIAIDLMFGELPVKIHPVVLIGKIIDFSTKYLINIKSKLSGVYLTVFVLFLSLALAIIFLFIFSFNWFVFVIISSLALSSLFSFKLLLSSANDIKKDLSTDLTEARKSMSFLVSRKTDELNEKQISSAVIETLTENITDSCVSVFFYYLFTGIIALICILIVNSYLTSLFSSFYIINYNIINLINNNLFYVIATLSLLSTLFYRIINTLDAMVGYKDQKYLLIGWFPAKLDDLLNFIPSRFSGLMVVFAAFLLKFNWKNSYFILKRDWNNCPSPNSGFTMAAAAGALDIQLEKKGVYTIGDENQELKTRHIVNAIKLTRMSIFLSLIFLFGIFCLIVNLLL